MRCRSQLPLLLAALALLCGAVHGALNLTLSRAQPLPFPVAPHPLQLSTALFASSEEADGSQRTLADEPFPTGAWWTNLVLARGESAVVSMPYVFRVLQHRLHVCFPFRVVTPHVIQNGFISQLVVSSAAETGDVAPPNAHQVVGFDTFGTTVRFSRGEADEFNVFLVRGSPYISMEFSRSRPVIESTDGLSITRVKKNDGLVFMDGSDVDFAVFSVMVSNGQMWYIFASDLELDLQMDGAGRVVAEKPFTGALRIALALEATTMPYLLESASVYPVGGDVSFTVDNVDDSQIANMEFRWKTKSFASYSTTTDSSARHEAELLMLALPHHMDTLQIQEDKQAKNANSVVDTLRYTSIRGLMKGVLGNVWYMRETLPAVQWNFADDGLFSDEYDPKEINNSSVDDEKEKREAMRADVKSKIIASLPDDIGKYSVLTDDSYNFGKQIGREARLLLIAHKFEQDHIVSQVLEKMEKELELRLKGMNGDKFVYDETYGGVVTADGIRNQDADFGNGYYNDHHFHYGYFIYALAVVRKFDPDFIQANALACAMLLADIGTPLDAQMAFFDGLPAKQFFPAARHKDWFMGHSYASGLFPMEVGKSQESSSECINAYYAMMLFSSLDADADDASSYHQYTRLMLAMELRSTKMYWHMQENSQIYEPIFAKNAMVGVVGEMSVVYSTWFGDHAVYVHGINLLPFTPITTELLDEPYVVHEYPLLDRELDDLDSNNIWRSIVVLDHAILDGAKAWDELVETVTAYDTWNSPSNSMYWIATRPSWYSQKNRDVLAHPATDQDDMCFGYPECSTAGDNGTALLCCSTLPGCCPSSLGCCPKEDPVDIPANACFGELQCGLLGLGCCNTIDGCCEPDPVSGTVLGCCKDQHPVFLPSAKPTASANDTQSVCYGEPQCAAAKLDCCSVPGGCCAGSGPKLDCCSTEPIAAAPTGADSPTEDEAATCHSQPACAAAGLDCCATDAGCCEPDPKTGAVLDCCVAVTSSPARAGSAEVDTCHDEPVCAAAKLLCCDTDAGCCAPDPVSGAVLDCCKSASASTRDGDASTAGEADVNGKTLTRLFIGVAALGVVGLAVYAVITWYRRRGYNTLDRDMRALYCAGMLIAVIAFFVFLIIMG